MPGPDPNGEPKTIKASPLGMIGGSAAGQVIGFGLQALGQGMQRRQQEKLNKIQEASNQRMMDYSNKKQLEMWEATSYPAQIEQMKKAGLNPGLMFGMGGSGGATTGGTTPLGVSGGNAQAPHMGAFDIAQLGLMAAQKANIEADTANKQADTANKPKTGLEIDSRTANNLMDNIIKEYTGKEAKDTYEQIKSPNRGIEAKTYQEELEARQGVAGTIYELWQTGKLTEKSLNEIEEIALKNAKTREEIRKITKEIDLLGENITGKKIQNMLDQMDVNLLEKIGGGKDSSKYIGILAQIFMKLLNK